TDLEARDPGLPRVPGPGYIRRLGGRDQAVRDQILHSQHAEFPDQAAARPDQVMAAGARIIDNSSARRDRCFAIEGERANVQANRFHVQSLQPLILTMCQPRAIRASTSAAVPTSSSSATICSPPPLLVSASSSVGRSVNGPTGPVWAPGLLSRAGLVLTLRPWVTW